jgi:hypothetical protein
MDLYIFTNGEQQGPFAGGQITTMWNSGLLTADALYWREGMAEWKPVSELMTPIKMTTPTQATPTRAIYQPATDTFSGTMSQMVKLALRAVQSLGWKIESANEGLGLVTFETDISWGSWTGVACTLTIEELGEGKMRVNGAGKQILRGGHLVPMNLFGEAQSKAQKAIDKMKEIAR